MYFELIHREIQARARKFAQEELTDQVLDQAEATGIFSKEVIQKMAAQGFFGIKIPKTLGGMGADHRAYVLVMEEIAKVSAVASLYVSSPNSLSGGPLLLSGTKEQQEKYLRPCATGEKMLCFGLTEPNAGSDAGSIMTRAVKTEGGYILDGRKTFITMAPLSDFGIIYAKTDPTKRTRGISAFIVDMKAPGVSFGKPENKMGLKGCATSDIILDHVFVSEKDRLGEENMGFINAMKTLDVGRMGVAAQAIGVAAGSLEDGIALVKEKKSCPQGTAFALARMASGLEAARQLVYRAAWIKDTCHDPKASTMAASMAKLFATEICCKICSEAVSLFPMEGTARGTRLERRFRDCRVFTIYEGTSQVQEMVISGQLLA